MKAIILNEFGSVDNLLEKTLPTPTPADTEIVIQVKALSINPVDVKTRAGKGLAGRFKELKPLILGWDVSGTIVGKGKDVTDFAVGDDVFGMINFPGHGQAYAEYVVAPASHVALKPKNITHEEAAAATLAALTAWQAFTSQSTVTPGDKILIHAAAGGVGHFAVQIAKHFGAHVIGTSSEKNKAFVFALGADEHIDYRSQKFEDMTHEIDLVLDAVGGDTMERSVASTKSGGTIITIPSGAGLEAAIEKAKAKDIKAFFFLVSSNGKDMKQLALLLEKGILKSHVFKVFPLSQMKEAHLALEAGVIGKVIITP